MSGEAGSGSALVLAIAGGLVAAMALVLPLYSALAVRQAVAGAADAAALAAADTASGLIAGYPCEAAESVAGANGTSLTSCTVDGLVVTVSASRVILGFPVSATATAGPAVPTAD